MLLETTFAREDFSCSQLFFSFCKTFTQPSWFFCLTTTSLYLRVRSWRLFLSSFHLEESSWMRRSFSLSFAVMDFKNASSLFAEDRRKETISSNGLEEGEEIFWRARALEVGMETPSPPTRVWAGYWPFGGVPGVFPWNSKDKNKLLVDKRQERIWLRVS